MIKLVRVDDRLLHGQVAFQFKEHFKLKRILVLNDVAANDDYTKQILHLAAPRGVDLVIEKLAAADKAVREIESSDENGIVITGSIPDTERISKYIHAPAEINIGGLRNRLGGTQISENVYLTKEDILGIKTLLKDGHRIRVYRTPSDQRLRIDFDTITDFEHRVI